MLRLIYVRAHYFNFGGRLIYIVLKFVKVRASKNVVRQIKTTFSCPDVNIRFVVCYAVFLYTTDLYMYD